MTTEVMNTKQKNVADTTTSERQTQSRSTYIPRTDIYESKEHLLLMTDMPGVHQDSVDITVERNILTIAGKVSAPATEGYNLTYSEYGIGDFHRVFTLSNEVDRDRIEASMKDGVLKLTLPKSQRAIPRKITVHDN